MTEILPKDFEGEMIMRKILVVDDDQVMLTLARRVLSPKYEIVTATGGEEAIKIFEREKPDLVLSDLLMPKMDGYELHRNLQEKFSENVPVIFMTADESDESESKGFAIGAADYIRKPFKPDILLRRVENIINNLDKIHGLKTAASTDPMTGLLNKTASQIEISALAKKSSGALMMIDLDSFKLVNDIYGHGMGDGILISLVELIKRSIDLNAGDLAGRMGGDEFVAYLQNVHDEKILHEKTIFLNEELVSFAKKYLGEDMEIPLGVSVGAVFAPDEGTDFETLYKKADSALYDVKQHGKHGLSIYGVKNRSENIFAKVEKLSHMRMILAERNVENTAYFVDFENFKIIYRLLSRIASSHGNGLQLLQFTVKSENFSAEFKAKLFKILRKSDCITQSGNKILVLIMEKTVEESQEVCEKIFSQMKDFSADEVTFESEKIF